MKFLSILPIIILLFYSNNIVSQKKLDYRLLTVNFLNKDCLDLNNFYRQFNENETILNVFSNEKVKLPTQKEFYVYISHFFISTYSPSKARKNFRVYFFTKEFELIEAYNIESDLALNNINKPKLLENGTDLDQYEIDYVKSMLNLFKNNNFKEIENEQLNKKGLVCSCYSYESIYHITPDMNTDVYFFDLFYKKLASGDFEKNK